MTKEFLEGWQFTNTNISFKIMNQAVNIGPLKNIKAITDAASGDYLIWMSDDDYFIPGSIEECLKVIKSSAPDFLKFGLVVYSENLRTTFFSGYGEELFSKKGQVDSFMKIYTYSHVLSGTCVKRQVALDIPESYSANIYPMSLWCASSAESAVYSPYPFAVHMYGNEVFWDGDVDISSQMIKGKQSEEDSLTALNILPVSSLNPRMKSNIYKYFLMNRKFTTLNLLIFEIEINWWKKLALKVQSGIIRKYRDFPSFISR